MLWLIAVVMSLAAGHVNTHASTDGSVPLNEVPPFVVVYDCVPYGQDRESYAWYWLDTVYLCGAHDWQQSADWGLTMEVALRHELAHAWQAQHWGPLSLTLAEGHADWVAHGHDCARATYHEYCLLFVEALEGR